MRILFVHEVNYRRKVVYEIHDFPELLSLRGHDVTFLDYPEHEPRSGLARWFDLRTERTDGLARAHAGASVDLVTPGRVFPPPLDRPAASLTQVPALRRELRSGTFDVVVLYGVPTNGWQTVRLARRYDVPVLFRAIDISHELRPTVYSPLIRRAERFIVRNADAVSTNNVALRDYVIDHGAAPETTSVDYPGIDLERFSPGPRPERLASRYGLGADDRVVLFMGTFFRFAGLDWLLDMLAPVLRDRRDLRVVLMGGGEVETVLRDKVRSLRLDDRVVFTGFIDYPDLADHLRLGDVAVNPFSEELVTRCALPGKVLQYAASGLPTVCTRLDGMKGLVPEGSGVRYRAPGAAFIEAIIDWIDDPLSRLRAGRAARATMEQTCRWDVAVDAFEARIAHVAGLDTVT